MHLKWRALATRHHQLTIRSERNVGHETVERDAKLLRAAGRDLQPTAARSGACDAFLDSL